MANSLVIHKGPGLAKREIALRAAQYVRMSTDRQQYSIPNQMAAIALYAAQHNLSIVRTYIDEATSGLKLKNRHGLIDLLNDVQSNGADFSTVLVFDVSRWGRFQDIDESAYYEFICKQARIKVVYCAEIFENDGSLMSGIFKSLKRIMAAEYSRELSEKVFAGQSRSARLGFWVGGQPSFALRRELVDGKRHSKGLLERGQQKSIHGDKVILRVGPAEEVATVRWIFETFVKDRISETGIARQLNAKGIPHHRGSRWCLQMVGRILRNEAYVGNTIYNRTSNKLRQHRIVNPPAKWVRGENAHEQIIPHDLFDEAQCIFERRHQKLSSEEMLKKLRILQRRRGRLSRAIIDQAQGMPRAHIYDRRFGSLRKAYALIGYTPEIDCNYLEARAARTGLIMKLADQIVAGVPQVNPGLIAERAGGCLAVRDDFFVSLRVLRCWRHSQRKCPIWTLGWRTNPRPGLFVLARMDDRNERPLDYILVPASGIPEARIMLSEKPLVRRLRRRFESVAGLIRALKRRLTR